MKDLAPRQYKGPTTSPEKGLLIIMTGDGKGKTSAAYGMVLRSLGHGYRVAIVQFIKGRWISGEVSALKKFGDRIKFLSAGKDFTWKTKDQKQERQWAKDGWRQCVNLLKSNHYQLYVFDEILYAMKYGYLSEKDILKGLKARSDQAHVILTGRGCPSALIKQADLVTRLQVVKHPFNQGILAQQGIDF